MSYFPSISRQETPGIDRPYRVALVSYLNTAPFLEGLRAYYDQNEVELLLMPPAACARALRDDLCDCALVPVGALTDFPRLTLLPEFCLGANGAVESVLIVGNGPIENMKTLLRDPESRSSNLLANLLLKHYWQQSVNFGDNAAAFASPESLLAALDGQTGAVLIGDKAISWKDHFPYTYDLPEYWQKATGLPFVFAVWASKTGTFPPGFREALNRGLGMISSRVHDWSQLYTKPLAFVRHYLQECMSYRFDAPKHESFRLFRSFSDADISKSAKVVQTILPDKMAV